MCHSHMCQMLFFTYKSSINLLINSHLRKEYSHVTKNPGDFAIPLFQQLKIERQISGNMCFHFPTIDKYQTIFSHLL